MDPSVKLRLVQYAKARTIALYVVTSQGAVCLIQTYITLNPNYVRRLVHFSGAVRLAYEAVGIKVEFTHDEFFARYIK